MQDVILGLAALAVGGLVCSRGYLAMRIIIPIWGLFTGFLLGSGVVAAVTGDGFLRSLLAWLVGVVVGLAFAAVAYLSYEISVFLAMSAVGFTLGSSALVALGVTWSWLVVMGGLIAGAALGVLAIGADVPGAILVVLTALAGASTVVFGAMLVTGAVDTADFDTVRATDRFDGDWWWYALHLVVAVAGVAAQLRHSEELRASLRAHWAATRGPDLRGG